MGLCGSVIQTNQRKLLLLGLDGAGKTSIALALEHPTEIVKPPDTVPSGQASAVTRKHKGLQFVLWDLGGALALRPYWRHHFVGAQGVVFVVDAADRELFPEAREALRAVAGDALLMGIPFVVVANRGTAAGAASPAELSTELDLATILGAERKWAVQVAEATADPPTGLHELLDFMAEQSKPL